MCLTFYMVASACGMVLGGFLAVDPARSEKIVGVGFGIAAMFALTIGYAPLAPMAVPVLFACMGVASGIAGPSRDLIVKRAAPPNATGRVYGVVYSGLDIGQAAAPLVFGPLLDLHRPADIWLGIALVQGLLILSAFNVAARAADGARAGGCVGLGRSGSGRRGALLRSCPPKPACGRLLLLILRYAARPTAPILRLSDCCRRDRLGD